MFRQIRRAGQALPQEEVDAVFSRGTYGVLALQGDDGYPYSVPLNYVRDGEHLYFHCALKGHKIDALQNSDKASICVVDAHEVDPANLTTRYRSVIAFGRLSIVEDDAECRRILALLRDRLAPGETKQFEYEMQHYYPHMHVLDLHMEYVTGKEQKALAAKRRQDAARQ